MLASIALLLLAGDPPAERTTLPRHVDQAVAADSVTPPPRTATDDPAFILTAVESSRQALLDTRGESQALANEDLRAIAQQIARRNEQTLQLLEGLAKRKGWRLPAQNPERATTLPAAPAHRAGANFIVHQISFHESTVAQFRAQIEGSGDADLKHALKKVLPGYERNLHVLLAAKP